MNLNIDCHSTLRTNVFWGPIRFAWELEKKPHGRLNLLQGFRGNLTWIYVGFSFIQKTANKQAGMGNFRALVVNWKRILSQPKLFSYSKVW